MMMHEVIRDAKIEALREIIEKVPPERLRRLLADIRLSGLASGEMEAE